MERKMYKVIVKGKPDFETMCYYQAKFIALMENGVVIDTETEQIVFDFSGGRYGKVKRI